MNNKLLSPPEYCPDALATDIGWINPKNGEILILVKDLRHKIAMKAKEDAMVADNAKQTVESVVVPVLKEVAVVKRGRGRPRKDQQ